MTVTADRLWLLLFVVLGCDADPALRAPAEPPARPAPASGGGLLEAERWETGGVPVFFVPQPGTGLVSVRFTIRGGGSMNDPSGGAAAITAQAALRGFDGLDEQAFSARLGAIGARLDYEMEEGFVSFEGEVLARNLEPCLELVVGAMSRPSLTDDGVEVARRLRMSRLEHDLEDDALLTERAFLSFVYQGHPLGRPLEGTWRGLEAVTPETVRSFHASRYQRSRLSLGVAGDIAREDLEPLLNAAIRAWPEEDAASAEVPEVEATSGGWLLVDKPARTQNSILIGHPLVPPGHDDYLALRLAGVVLGEGWRSRLSALRSEAGMSYSVSSGVWRSPVQSTLVISTFAPPHEALGMVDAVEAIYAGLREEPVSEAELERAKRVLRGMVLREVDDGAGRLEERMRAWHYGLPASWPEDVEAVTLEEVRGAVERHLRPERLRVVMLCTARHFEARVRARPGVQSVEVAPYDEDGL